MRKLYVLGRIWLFLQWSSQKMMVRMLLPKDNTQSILDQLVNEIGLIHKYL